MASSYEHLIIGYGYLGQALLKRYEQQTCWLINRSNKSKPSFEQHHPLALDINESSGLKKLEGIQNKRELIVYFMVPPSKVDLEQFPHFVRALDQLNIKRRILVSSTVVYGRQERVVDADSEVILDSDRAKRQYQIECEWLKDNDHSAIVRLAGIYGPGRIIGRSLIEQGNQLSGDPDAWLNLIHVDDAASLLECLAYLEQVNQIELGSDGEPLSRKKYYSTVAALLKKKLPDFVGAPDDEKGRRCDIELTKARTGWLPKYTDIKESLINSI